MTLPSRGHPSREHRATTVELWSPESWVTRDPAGLAWGQGQGGQPGGASSPGDGEHVARLVTVVLSPLPLSCVSSGVTGCCPHSAQTQAPRGTQCSAHPALCECRLHLRKGGGEGANEVMLPSGVVVPDQALRVRASAAAVPWGPSLPKIPPRPRCPHLQRPDLLTAAQGAQGQLEGLPDRAEVVLHHLGPGEHSGDPKS